MSKLKAFWPDFYKIAQEPEPGRRNLKEGRNLVQRAGERQVRIGCQCITHFFHRQKRPQTPKFYSISLARSLRCNPFSDRTAFSRTPSQNGLIFSSHSKRCALYPPEIVPNHEILYYLVAIALIQFFSRSDCILARNRHYLGQPRCTSLLSGWDFSRRRRCQGTTDLVSHQGLQIVV